MNTDISARRDNSFKDDGTFIIRQIKSQTKLSHCDKDIVNKYTKENI